MAGTLTINVGSKWMPASWVFDGVLALLAEELSTDDSGLSRTLLEARTSARGSLDLRSADAAQLRSLVRACDRVREKLVKGGPGAFDKPEAFAPFLRHFDALLALLRADPRLAA